MLYDRIGMAKRIRSRRKELHLSIDDVAAQINKAPHYYGEIERGNCGMSLNTLLDLSVCLELSTDYILFGTAQEDASPSMTTAYKILKKYDEDTQKNAVAMMKYYLSLSNK